MDFRPDFRDLKDFKDVKNSYGLKPDSKKFRLGVRDLSDSKSSHFGPDFKDLSSDWKGFRPYSRDFTSDFKDFNDFAWVFKLFKPDFKKKLLRFKDNREWRHCRDFRSDFRTFLHWISEVIVSTDGIFTLNISK